MGELNGNGSVFRAPDNSNAEFNQSPAYPGSWQQALRNNEGLYCAIDFLIGTETLVRKEGIIYDVGVSFVVLFEPRSGSYVVCDLYAIKFVTFAGTGVLPTAKVPRRNV